MVNVLMPQVDMSSSIDDIDYLSIIQHIGAPLYYLRVEFAKMKTARDEGKALFGFTLSMKGIVHELIIRLPSQTLQGNPSPGSVTHQQKSAIRANFKQWVSHLSQWAVRADNLNKKYEAICEIGFGG